jgi:hypothetical protein
MTYWRMQLHPGGSREAVKHAAKSLSAGFIGLDFAEDVGDLIIAEKSALPQGQKDCWAFAHEMEIGDKVLIITHHFPLALVTVDSGYNYIRQAVPEIGVWFRHFRRVRDVFYYADHVTNARSWESITMTDTISPLRSSSSKSFKLIESWSKA